MPLTAKELLVRDAKRDIRAELLQSIREMKAGEGKVAYQFNTPKTAKADLGIAKNTPHY